MVEVREIKTNRELKDFIRFPQTLYKGNPYWVPELIADEMTNLRKDKNPAFDYCEARYFVAEREGKIVGRIAGIVNHKANETWNQKRVRFSHCDFIDDAEVVDALFDAVEAWAREKGCAQVHGPLGFCDLDKEGMLVEGFDQPGTFVALYNHPYYKEQLTRRGYVKDIDWVEYLLNVPDHVNEKLDRLQAVVLRRQKATFFDYKSKKELSTKLAELFELLNESYEKLYGVVALTEKQIEHYKTQFLPMVQPDFLKIILDKNGKMCAFGLGLPTIANAVRKSNGRLFPTGLIRILHALKHNDTLELMLVAVHPDLQGSGLSAVLMNEFTKSCIKNGIKYAESGPELETNDKVQALWKQYDTVLHKRRRCFIKDL